MSSSCSKTYEDRVGLVPAYFLVFRSLAPFSFADYQDLRITRRAKHRGKAPDTAHVTVCVVGNPPSGRGQLLCLTSLRCGVQYSCGHHHQWLLSTDRKLQDTGPIQKGSRELSGFPMRLGVIDGVCYGCHDCVVMFVILHREMCMQTHSEIPI